MATDSCRDVCARRVADDVPNAASRTWKPSSASGAEGKGEAEKTKKK